MQRFSSRSKLLQSLSLLLIALVMGALLHAQDGVPSGTDFRTEEDDLQELQETDDGAMLSVLGAVRIPFEVDENVQASFGLYTPENQLVRILGQAVSLNAGQHRIYWDGLDLFGNIVPAGTELQFKAIMNPGLRAFYEFTVGHAQPRQPWGGVVAGDGLNQIHGGWLGDHSSPNAAAAIGDYIVLGCFLAEHGDNVIMVDLDGNKIWGEKIAGWTGPAEMDADARHVYALIRGRQRIVRFDPFEVDRRSRQRDSTSISSGNNEILSYAAHDGKLHYVARNSDAIVDHFRQPRLGINNAQAEPQVLNTQAPVQFYTISPQTAFNSTFTGSGNPQAGINMIERGGNTFLVVPFNNPVQFGGLIISQMPSVEKIQVFALKSGLSYDQLKHSPLREAGGGMDDMDSMLMGGGARSSLDGMDLSDFDPNWELLGEVKPENKMNFISVAEGYVNTAAIYFRAVLNDGVDPRNQPVRLNAARVTAEPFRRLDAAAKVEVPGNAGKVESTGSARHPGWKIQAARSVSPMNPVKIVLDYGRLLEVDGIVLLNPVNDRINIESYSGAAVNDWSAVSDDEWRKVGEFRGRSDSYLRSLTSSMDDRTHIISTGRTMQLRALRFTVESGYKTGRWAQGGRGGENQDNPRRVECEEVALLMLNNQHEVPPAFKLVTVDGESGETLSETGSDEIDVQHMRFSPDGKLFAVMNNRLMRAEITAAGISGSPLNDVRFENPASLAVSAELVAVGDRGRNAVYLFTHDGRARGRLGGSEKVRMPGKWQPEQIANPQGLAIDSAGKIWVAEQQFAPKRVARFSADGKCEKEFFGPPMYGGGGSLDRNLQSFYYRGMEFDLDFSAGTSRLKAKNDAVFWANEMTPTLENSSFSFTGVDTPIYHNGRRYIVGGSGGGTVITIKDDDNDVWRPAAVIGPAHNSVFLGKDIWRDHFAEMNLIDHYFIWCDRNDDGMYQIDEVELFTKEQWEARGGEGRPPTRGAFGPGLSIIGRYFHTKPYDFTPGGVPLYRFADFKTFSYDELAPHYRANYTLGGPRSAKPYYGGGRYVMSDGAVIKEAQPYVIQPDGTIMGGPVTTQPSDYLPPINGKVVNQFWRFAGGTVSESPVGEVVAINSNNGFWYLWGGNYGMIIGTFFDGSEGGWNSGLRAVRGTDVTGRKHDWEGWGAYFVRAEDGNCYAIAGKGFHGISRIEGVDNFSVRTARLRVPAAAVPYNTRLREVLKSRAEARAYAMNTETRKYCWPEDVRRRRMRFHLDGEIEEWGNRADMHRIGPDDSRLVFDVAATENELLVMFSGQSRMANPGTDWRKMHTSGFAFEIKLRPDGRNRSRDVAAGDRRVIFSQIDGKWTGVLYDYTPGRSGEGMRVNSHYATVDIADVRKLTEAECRVAVQVDSLSFDILDPGSSDDWLETEPSLDMALDMSLTPVRTTTPSRPEGVSDWNAEIAIPWSTLGVDGPGNMRIDFGVHSGPDDQGNPGGSYYWSNRAIETLGDEALAALINPAAWGYMGRPRQE